VKKKTVAYIPFTFPYATVTMSNTKNDPFQALVRE
jgi:hypothetical protein